MDKFLLRRHQQIVDWLQKQPSWICRQLALFIHLTNGMLAFVSDDLPGVLLNVLLGFLYVGITFSPSLLTHFGSKPYRLIGVSTVFIFVILPGVLGILTNYSMMTVCLFASYLYFAGCRPPKPRVPKPKLQPKVAHA